MFRSAAYWDEKGKRVAIAQLMRLAGAILAEPKGGVFSKWQSARVRTPAALRRACDRAEWPRFPAPNFHRDDGSAHLLGSDVARHFREVAPLGNRLAVVYGSPHTFAR